MFKRILSITLASALLTTELLLPIHYILSEKANTVQDFEWHEPIKIETESVSVSVEPTSTNIESQKYELETTEEPTEEQVSNNEDAIDENEDIGVTDEEIELLALVMLAEAEGESELGQRLVIDVILNRVDGKKHPNTIYDVIFQKGQFTSMWNGRSNRVTVTDEARQLVVEEIKNRTNYDVIYFKMYGYFKNFGTPLFQEGCHYFSGY